MTIQSVDSSNPTIRAETFHAVFYVGLGYVLGFAAMCFLTDHGWFGDSLFLALLLSSATLGGSVASLMVMFNPDIDSRERLVSITATVTAFNGATLVQLLMGGVVKGEWAIGGGILFAAALSWLTWRLLLRRNGVGWLFAILIATLVAELLVYDQLIR